MKTDRDKSKELKKKIQFHNEIIHERHLVEKFRVQQEREPQSDTIIATLSQGLYSPAKVSRNREKQISNTFSN